jgi:thiol:disulfide interchange protein
MNTRKNVVAVMMVVMLVVIISIFGEVYKKAEIKQFNYLEKNGLNTKINQLDSFYLILFSPNCITCKRVENNLKESRKPIENLWFIDVDNNLPRDIEKIYKKYGVPVVIYYKAGLIEDLYTIYEEKSLLDFLEKMEVDRK